MTKLPARRIEDFFAYARERHKTYLSRASGQVAPWTKDKILQNYRFTNVFRELDRTTLWFAKYVRNPMREEPSVLLATVLFRWFNRISTGEAIFCQPALDGKTPWDVFHETGDVGYLRQPILSLCGAGPYVTGSYIIKTPNDMNKLDGVLWCVDRFNKDCIGGRNRNYGWQLVAANSLAAPKSSQYTLEGTWRWLCDYDFLGGFMAYEIVSDLRHTALLNRAPDIMTWANPGPGAVRGLARIAGSRVSDPHAAMRELLRQSRFKKHWPDDWPVWEMREVEHTLCEFDKYERVRLGEGTPRQRFRGGE